MPLQIDSISHEVNLAASATAWVQSNKVKLSQHFGVDLMGCIKEAYTLLLKQTRGEEEKAFGRTRRSKYKQHGHERSQKLVFRYEF